MKVSIEFSHLHYFFFFFFCTFCNLSAARASTSFHQKQNKSNGFHQWLGNVCFSIFGGQFHRQEKAKIIGLMLFPVTGNYCDWLWSLTNNLTLTDPSVCVFASVIYFCFCFFIRAKFYQSHVLSITPTKLFVFCIKGKYFYLISQ